MSGGKFKKPEPFSMKDLYINVSLVACIDGVSRDFVGRQTFSTSFFKKGIGFGITDISIEINPSLQPLVDITFKDLYGNTIFGTQRGVNDSIDTSVLFNWPPPKFIFSFKGYLGRQVTWILNLKTTNVSYVPSDGSFEIKCTFVPNQWGFFADIPFLYLIAAKKLRQETYQESGLVCNGKELSNNSIFSFIRVGKYVDMQTKEVTKEFDGLKEQLNALKYNASNALYGSKTVEFNTSISGFVNGTVITGFKPFFIDKVLDETQAKSISKRGDIVDKVNTFLLLNMKATSGFAGTAPIGKYIAGEPPTYQTVILSNTGDKNFEDFQQRRKKVNAFLDKNIEAIDNEIKKRIFKSSKSQISKLTIGEVLGQISRDSGFILGKILEEGIKGYVTNKEERDGDNASKFLIGRSYPLYINAKGEEVPALVENLDGKDIAPNIEENEWKFINNFIEAISQGIADNNIDSDMGGRATLTTRINNAEILEGNPYKPYYTNIAENLLIRSGIISHLTRSDDPNKPGDYRDNHLNIDSDSAGSIASLANDDMGNLKKEILSQLSFKDKRMLRRFCTFFSKLFESEFGAIAQPNGKIDYDLSSLIGYDNLLAGWYFQNVDKEILDLKIPVDDYFDLDIDEDQSWKTYFKELNNSKLKNPDFSGELEWLSIRKLFKEIYRKEDNFENYSEGGEQPGFINLAYLDVDEKGDGTYTAYLVKNNGIFYSYPVQKENEYFYVIFSGDDVADLKNKHSSKSDSEFDEDDKEENEPDGMVYITTNEKKGKTLNRIKVINKVIEDGKALDYRAMKKHKTYQSGSTIISTLSQYQWTQPIQTAKNGKYPHGYPADNLAYTIYSHQIDTDFSNNNAGDSNLVWGLLYSHMKTSNVSPGNNHRVALKTMCDSVLKKLDDVETDQNLIIGNVASKANEHSNAIYKQMHTIFQQWQSIASVNNGCGSSENYEGLALALEKRYGGCNSHIEKPLDKNLRDSSVKDTVFVYDYPLASINNKKINVKNSIINIEPIYKPNGSTTILNIIQQICTKNNFTFVPFPGDPGSDDISSIFSPYLHEEAYPKNYFHILFTPTPETRSKLSNDSAATLTDYLDSHKNQIQTNAILIEFGKTNNQVFKSVSTGTDATKPTAESIINLQSLVDKKNSSKRVTMDCSMLSVVEGRSYTAKVEMLGNSQVYPMQYFFLNNFPLFGGLYQIMKVSHSISPNKMDTSIEGIRMRFTPGGGFGGVEPVTIESLENLNDEIEILAHSSSLATVRGKALDSDGNLKESYYNVGMTDSAPPLNISNFTKANIKKVFNMKGYTLNESGKLNIIGVRKAGKLISNKFDDVLILYWKFDGNEYTKYYTITTDPGAIFDSLDKYDSKGIAIMKEGHYSQVYKIGLHHGQYEAMHQARSISFYREKWPYTNKYYKFDPATEIYATIGANIHRANPLHKSSMVNNWSEGCQVFADPNEFSEFMNIVKVFRDQHGQEYFDYTLINESDFNTAANRPYGIFINTTTKKISS